MAHILKNYSGRNTLKKKFTILKSGEMVKGINCIFSLNVSMVLPEKLEEILSQNPRYKHRRAILISPFSVESEPSYDYYFGADEGEKDVVSPLENVPESKIFKSNSLNDKHLGVIARDFTNTYKYCPMTNEIKTLGAIINKNFLTYWTKSVDGKRNLLLRIGEFISPEEGNFDENFHENLPLYLRIICNMYSESVKTKRKKEERLISFSLNRLGIPECVR